MLQVVRVVSRCLHHDVESILDIFSVRLDMSIQVMKIILKPMQKRSLVAGCILVIKAMSTKTVTCSSPEG